MHPDTDRMTPERLLVMFVVSALLALLLAAASEATSCRDLCAVLDLELVAELPCKCVCSDPVRGRAETYDRATCSDRD